MADVISGINQGIVNSITNVNLINAIGWFVFAHE